MPTPEQQPNIETQAPALEGMPAPSEQAEHFKTVAVRVSESLHSQLTFIAQLSGTSLSEEIRRAIENRIETAQEDVDLIAHAERSANRSSAKQPLAPRLSPGRFSLPPGH